MKQGKHVVFFRKELDGILISRILHQSMLPEKQAFDDEDDTARIALTSELRTRKAAGDNGMFFYFPPALSLRLCLQLGFAAGRFTVFSLQNVLNVLSVRTPVVLP